jgi:hypothetical protein
VFLVEDFELLRFGAPETLLILSVFRIEKKRNGKDRLRKKMTKRNLVLLAVLLAAESDRVLILEL